jgi:hypothetical protein
MYQSLHQVPDTPFILFSPSSVYAGYCNASQSEREPDCTTDDIGELLLCCALLKFDKDTYKD